MVNRCAADAVEGCPAVQDRLVRAFDWCFRDRTTGKVVIAQLPNLPLALFLVVTFVDRVFDPSGTAGVAVDVLATGALFWWAADEVLRGVNPFRRVLGGIVLVVAVAGLLLR